MLENVVAQIIEMRWISRKHAHSFDKHALKTKPSQHVSKVKF